MNEIPSFICLLNYPFIWQQDQINPKIQQSKGFYTINSDILTVFGNLPGGKKYGH